MFSIAGFSVSDAAPLFTSERSLVVRATRDTDGKRVVVKTLTEELPGKGRIARLRHEFAITSRVAGPGVIAAVELRRVGARLALVVEDFGGESLARLLAREPLPVARALEVGALVARALARVHAAGVVHKDVCPANVVVSADLATVKLIDFGIATELPRETPELVAPTVLEGTLAYMSPEQTGRMNRAVDWRSDLYALGVTLYEALAGRRPFESDDPLELVHHHLTRLPTPLCDVAPHVPEQVSSIVGRLLAKSAEDRYQSASAVADDLERAASELRESRSVSRFELGSTDRLDRFQLPQKLYGREGERARLLAAFDRVAAGGRTLLLVAGYSGIGKSSLVHEVHRPIVERRGHFISGKFDQLARNVPYASLIQAFRSLVRQLLAEPADVLARYRDGILAALGPNGQVIVDVIGEVEHVIGRQPPVPDLSAAEAQNRFNLAFEAFVRAFASAEHPLTLFLDDLQWADLPSLTLLGRFMTDPDTAHILCVGAYRDNEVDASHPLMLSVDRMRAQGADIETISLAPLGLDHVARLVEDALARGRGEADALATLAHARTGGNPFFLGQFLHALHDRGAVRFDPAKHRWTWDLDAIAAAGLTDNVVDLTVQKLRTLTEATQRALRAAAAIGNTFDLRTLAIAMERHPIAAAEGLAEALTQGLVVPVGGDYKFVDARLDADTATAIDERVVYRFLHDRVQQAAYVLVSVDERPALHLSIARQLLSHLPPAELHDRVFDVVGHIAIGHALVLEPAERRRFAELAFEAGRRAKASAGYRPALEYLTLARGFAGERAWDDAYELALELHLHLTEAAYLTGEYELMERHAAEVESRARELVDRVRVAEVRIQAYIGQNRLAEAIDTALAILRELGVEFPAAPTPEDVGAAIGETAAAVGGRSADALYELPELSDAGKRAAIRILQRITSATYVARPALFPLVPMKGVALSATLGNTGASTYAYACYGIILAGVVGDIPGASAFGQLAIRLVDRFGAKEFEARTRYIDACYVRHWCRPARETYESFFPIYRIGLETGDLEFSGWALMMAVFHGFFSGRPLEALERETAGSVAAIAQVKQATALGYARAGHVAMRCLMGLCPDAGLLVDPASDYDLRAQVAVHQAAGDAFGVANALFHAMLLAVLFGDEERAEALAGELDPWFPSMVSTLHVPTVLLIDSIWRSAKAARSDDAAREPLLARLDAQLAQLEKWAEHAPENHLAKATATRGLVARARGDLRTARQALRRAAELAQTHGNELEEALFLELLAEVWTADDEHETARAGYARAAHAWSMWGARAKAEHLERQHGPFARGAGFPSSPASRIAQGASLAPGPLSSRRVTHTATTTTEQGGLSLDVASVLKASQAISGEVELDALVRKMMTIVLENGGADLGMLVACDGDSATIVARATAGQDEVVTEHLALDEAIARGLVPGTVVNYVRRTSQAVVVDDAQAPSVRGTDPYMATASPRSVLCLPLVRQGKLAGLLYLENRVASRAFTEARLAPLELLAGQMAISLTNARLFAEVRAIERANARFVPYQFLRALSRNNIIDVRLGDHVQKEISIFFSDIRSFTRVVERLGPEATLAFVNEYLAVVEPAILDSGGFVDTYLGDGVMALFDRGADSAVAGAVAMQRALAAYNADRGARGDDVVRTGIGINTGSVMLATIGGQHALKCSVVGDAVNLASRVEGLTKRYGASILISEHTASRLRDRSSYALRRIARVQVVGKTEPVAIYEVLDGEPAAARDAKLATRDWLHAGLDAYAARRPKEALERFEACAASAPHDLVPQQLVLACRVLVRDGVPDDWDDVERLTNK